MNNLVNISEGTSLAIHGLGLLAESGSTRVNVKNAARRLNASEAHLAKVFAKLNRSGLISATRGPSGGYSLEKNPQSISFLDVYELFEAPIELGGCPLGKKHCAFGTCVFEGRIHKVSQEIHSILKNTRISDLRLTADGPHPNNPLPNAGGQTATIRKIK